jgi:hypothetical protein
MTEKGNPLESLWVVVDPSTKGMDCEDMSIFTVSGDEVVGCSEWMRADRETFDHIVKLHNEWLKRKAAT